MEDISKLMGELGMDNLDDDGYFDEDIEDELIMMMTMIITTMMK